MYAEFTRCMGGRLAMPYTEPTPAQEGTRIVTTHVYPPIPERGWDWCAHFEGDDPDPERNRVEGWGKTEFAAIKDLILNNDDPRCIERTHTCIRCGCEAVEDKGWATCSDRDCGRQWTV